MRTQADFRPPADLPDGKYTLIAGLFRTSDGRRLATTTGADHLTLGRITVHGRQHVMVPPNPTHVTSETFGSFAHLVGYDVAVPGPLGLAKDCRSCSIGRRRPRPIAPIRSLCTSLTALAGQRGAGDGNREKAACPPRVGSRRNILPTRM